MGVEEGTQRAVAAKKTRVHFVLSFFPLQGLQINLFDDFSYPAGPWILNAGLSCNIHCSYLKATAYLLLMLQVKRVPEMLELVYGLAGVLQ